VLGEETLRILYIFLTPIYIELFVIEA